MNAFEELMHRRWVVKKQDSTLYYKVKDDLKEIKKMMQNTTGYIITANQHLIKLEKIPGKAEPWMGIQDFSSIIEYQMLCYVLMFLEDKEREEQFVLSSLTEYITSQFEGIDWTSFTTRRQLVRVIKYCLSQYILIQTDGDEDKYASDITTEVLYENTGTSRYFLRNFVKDIMEYEKPSDFESSEWIDMDEDRGIIRKQRIYRKLLLSPGVYRNDNENEDFLYIRNYRNQISKEMGNLFSCNLHVHKSSAYVVLEDDCNMGKTFPSNNTLSDLVLMVNEKIMKQLKNKKIICDNNNKITLQHTQFDTIVQKVIKENNQFLPKKYQELEVEQFIKLILNEMIKLGFIEYHSENIIVYPIIGKIIGEMSER